MGKERSGLAANWAAQIAPPKSQGPCTLSVGACSASATGVSSARITASSKAVVVNTEDKIAPKIIKSEHPIDIDISSDFLEGDETEERKAALSSPIKGKQRLTNAVRPVPYHPTALTAQQAIVKIENVLPPPKRATGPKERPTNADLPDGCLDKAKRRRKFMTTYLQYLAGRNTADAWIVNDDENVLLMQCIWDYIYRANIEHVIEVGGSVFAIVSYLFVSLNFT